MSVAPIPATLGLADRLTLILAGLRGVVAARMAAARGAERALVPLLTLLWSRLHRVADRFARVAGGAAPTGVPRPASASRAPRPSGPRDRLPSGLAWLLRLVPEAAVYGAQLQALLATPAMADLLAAAPLAARIGRPLCRMLAVSPGPAARPRSPARTPKPVEPGLVAHDRTLTGRPPSPRAARLLADFAEA